MNEGQNESHWCIYLHLKMKAILIIMNHLPKIKSTLNLTYISASVQLCIISVASRQDWYSMQSACSGFVYSTDLSSSLFFQTYITYLCPVPYVLSKGLCTFYVD